MVSCTSAHCMAHSAQSDGMRERVCVVRTCQSMVLTSTDVLSTARLHIGATAALLQLCIAVRRPARRARRHTNCPPRSRNALLARSAWVEPKRTSEAIAMGALRSSNASVKARAHRIWPCPWPFTAILHSWVEDDDVAQSRRRGSSRLETTSM